MKKIDNGAFHGITPEHIKRTQERFEEKEKIRQRKREIWCYEIEKYRFPNESDTDFVARMGAKDRGLPGRWEIEGRIPQPVRARAYLEALNVPQEEISRIMFNITGVREQPGDVSQEGYVYPDTNGTKDASGRLGFKSVFLETNKIKPESVKLVICDTQSMVPEVRPRDMMLIDMSKTNPKAGKTYLIEVTDDPDTQVVCKLYPISNKQYSVVFENKDVYPTYKIEQGLVVIHGEVVWIGRLL